MTTKTIATLTRKLETTQAKCAKTQGAIKAKLQAEYDKVFAKDADLQGTLTKLESSTEYGSDEAGEIYRWTRFDSSDHADCLEYLEAYLSEQGVYLDERSDALTAHEGESLVINDEGDIFLGHKCVIHASEYVDEDTREKDEAKRNTLINAWMEKEGFFPGVFRADRHGNVFAESVPAQ